MSDEKRPKLAILGDRRPDDNQLQLETIQVLEAALEQARDGQFDEILIITKSPTDYGFASTFEYLGDAALGRDLLDDYLRDWRTGEC